MEKIKAVLKWLKSNWLLVLICAVVFAFFWKGTDQVSLYDNLFETYQAQSIDFQGQIKKILRSQQEEREAREVLRMESVARFRLLEGEFEERLVAIETDRNAEHEEIIEEHARDPQSLVRRLDDMFGIPEATQ